MIFIPILDFYLINEQIVPQTFANTIEIKRILQRSQLFC